MKLSWKLLRCFCVLGKKGFLRTLEALVAAVLAIIVLFALLSKSVPSNQDLPSTDVLEKLSFDNDFRNCALDNNLSCVNSSVYEFLPTLYKDSYSLHLSNNASFIPNNLPEDRRVYANSLFIAGNLTDINPVIVKLYYWS